MASKGAITVKIDPANMNGVIDGLSLLQDRYANVLMKNGATKGARKTLPTAKANSRKATRTGQHTRSLGVKYKGYRGRGWAVMLGSRRYFRVQDQGWGFGKNKIIDPPKYSHLIEGGRKAVQSKSGKLMPIKVKRLRPGKRGKAFGPGAQTNLATGRAKKVPGGWIVFAYRAKAVKPEPWLENSAPDYQRNIENSIVSEVRTGLPRLAAQAAAKGRTIYK